MGYIGLARSSALDGPDQGRTRSPNLMILRGTIRNILTQSATIIEGEDATSKFLTGGLSIIVMSAARGNLSHSQLCKRLSSTTSLGGKLMRSNRCHVRH